MPVQRTCPVCRGDDHLKVACSARRRLDLSPVICRSCGLVFINPMYTYDEDLAVYGSARAMHRPVRSGRPIESAHYREMAKARRCMDLLGRVVSPGDDVLEVGLGDGSLLKLLQDRGARPVGNDLDPEGCRFVEESFGIPTVAGAFEDAGFGDGKFDMIACSHVIEHLFEPVDALLRMRSLLRAGGHVFLETPNILRPKVGPRRLFSRPHRYYFSPRTLSLALHKAGFRVTIVREFNRFAFQVLARTASAEESPYAPKGDRFVDVARSIRRHALRYHTSLQFLWRKMPFLKDKMMYSDFRRLEGAGLMRELGIDDPPRRRRDKRSAPAKAA